MNTKNCFLFAIVIACTIAVFVGGQDTSSPTDTEEPSSTESDPPPTDTEEPSPTGSDPPPTDTEEPYPSGSDPPPSTETVESSASGSNPPPQTSTVQPSLSGSTLHPSSGTVQPTLSSSSPPMSSATGNPPSTGSNSSPAATTGHPPLPTSTPPHLSSVINSSPSSSTMRPLPPSPPAPIVESSEISIFKVKCLLTIRPGGPCANACLSDLDWQRMREHLGKGSMTVEDADALSNACSKAAVTSYLRITYPQQVAPVVIPPPKPNKVAATPPRRG